jgi:hypothetical protein
MTYEINAAHHQHELQAEAEHLRHIRDARSGTGSNSVVQRTRTALGVGIVELGLALGGDGLRRRTEERPGPHSIAV